MIKEMPEGTPIGEMQSSPQWILSHTVRFHGAVFVRIGEGEGVILIDRGKPSAFYFRHGRQVLKGHAASEYIRNQHLIDISLRRYSDEDYRKAQDFLNSSEPSPPQKYSDGTGPLTPESGTGPSPIVRETKIPLREVTVAHLGKTGEAEDEEESEESGVPDIEEVGKLLLGQIIKQKGVQAVSIFGRGTNVLSIGDVNLESLVILAEDMLQTAKNISSVIDTGSFVHLTLQIPGGTVIITPYYDEYLCILTTSGVNLGQIRKILRDIHATQTTQGVKAE